MSTRFFGEGNIGSDPACRMFPGNANQAPRGVLRLNVRFDNLVPTDKGLVDRGGFWANVELWGRQVDQWSSLYQRGQRIMVSGRMIHDSWEKDGETQFAFKIIAERVGILPFRVAQVIMETGQGQQQAEAPKQQENGQPDQSTNPQPQDPQYQFNSQPGMEAGGNNDSPY